MKPARRTLGHRLGTLCGWLVAPLFGLTSGLRRARTFHPRGPVFHARASRHVATPLALQELADRFTGDVLVRFSGALWKNEPSLLPDVLGCALRLRRARRESALATADDQDLLFATIRRPWTMPLSPWTTDAHNYLANDYFAVSPFQSQEVTQPFYLRLHHVGSQPTRANTRGARIAQAVRAGEVALDIEHSTRPFGPWQPLSQVRLERAAEFDGEALRFQPFRTGRGIQPYGFIHALRRGVYSISQLSRPTHERV
jgi:hypothetical protein